MRFQRKSYLKICITLHKLIFLSKLFDFMILDDLDLTQGHQVLRRVLRSIPGSIHAVASALFRSDAAALSSGASDDE